MPKANQTLYQNNLFGRKYVKCHLLVVFSNDKGQVTNEQPNRSSILSKFKLMISREQLAKEYIKIINSYYPVAGRLLRHCLVKILELNTDRNHKHSYYLGIYYPNRIGDHLLAMQDVFRDAAENMGLVEVVFFNASHLVKDPYSKIKQQNFRFWLELCWIANEKD